MGTVTPRAGLYKPDENGEVVDVAKINANSDIIDNLIKGEAVTSTTMPTDPVPGQQVYQTDTGFLLLWNGTEWTGRPWYIERFRATNLGLGALVNDLPWDDTRLGANNAVTGSAADWGLASFTDNKNHLLIPASGMWQLNFRVWASPQPLRSYILNVYAGGVVSPPGTITGGTLREATVNEPNGNNADEFASQFYAAKGDHIKTQMYMANAATGGPDNRVTFANRSYLRLQYMGPGNG